MDAEPAASSAVPEGQAAGRVPQVQAEEWASLRSQMRRFHPDCAGVGPVVPDAAPCSPRWPPGCRPPERWGSAAGLVGALRELVRCLESLCGVPWALTESRGAERAVSAASPSPGSQPAAPAEPPMLLGWLLALSDQWSAAGFPRDFGNTGRYTEEEYESLGGGRFHHCDIVCEGRQHRDRLDDNGNRSCCVARDAVRVLYRILSSEYPFRNPYDNGSGRLEYPDVPVHQLPEDPHGAVEGILSAFIYSYHLMAPHRRRRISLPASEHSIGWTLTDLQVVDVEPGGRAARAGIHAKDVVLEVNGSAVESDAAVESALAQGSAVEFTVASMSDRCAERALQLFGTANRAMRDVSGAEGEEARQLECVLSIFKPWIWRLDRFMSTARREGGVLYRGVGNTYLARDYRVGGYVLYTSFTSLGRNAKKVLYFTHGSGTWMVVHAAAAFNISWASHFPGENELLLGLNTVLRILNRSTEDVRLALGTRHDGVSLAQMSRDSVEQCTPEDTLRDRVQGLAAHKVLFEGFKQQYVEPRVIELHRGSAASPSQAAEAPKPQGLHNAFDTFLGSARQWLLLIAPQGGGKSSALLRLYCDELSKVQGTTAQQYPVPLLVNLPLLASSGGGNIPDDWVRLQAERLLHGRTSTVASEEWHLLDRRGLVVFADSADEAAAGGSDGFRNLAARAGLPRGSKGVISVREESLHRLGLAPADIAGKGCAVLRLLPFHKEDQRNYCQLQGSVAANEAANWLEDIPLSNDCAERRRLVLEALPGCVPDQEAQALHEALQRSKFEDGYWRHRKDRIDEFARAASRSTFRRVRDICGRLELSTLLFTMAADAADDLRPGTDIDAVIYCALRRRARRAVVRVPAEAWPPTISAAGAKVEALMRVAEAVAAVLTVSRRWIDRVDRVVATAAKLGVWASDDCVLDASQVSQLLAGVPVRISDSDDGPGHVAMPHRRVHEVMAAEWAVRAAERGRAGHARQICHNLGGSWACAWETSDGLAQRIADAAQRCSGYSAEQVLRLRMDAAILMRDAGSSADALETLVKEAREQSGADSEFTAEALVDLCTAMCRAKRTAEAVQAGCDARRVYKKIYGHVSAKPDFYYRAVGTLGAALCADAPRGSSEQRLQGEDFLLKARSELQHIPGLEHIVSRFTSELAESFEIGSSEADSELLRRSEQLLRDELQRLTEAVGATHEDALVQSFKLAVNVERQGRSALSEWRHCFQNTPQCRELILRRADEHAPHYARPQLAIRSSVV
eukprot:TRINITY_DN43015_c0_g3_i2.p1 TRINITY_DN43015_c0_g3~~TRINITY_DN43015_c0_g3_i2.p1  ORF type:complete len:1285 (+),score=175.08 TRINITY_DN43015_c0_g3_i2:97-3855(+)